MKSEARLTVFESIAMIVGNSIGTGIVAVPYLAAKNNLATVLWMVALGYVVNVIMHLIIAELSYNNGGAQLVKCFENELFSGKLRQVFTWIVFGVYGLATLIGVSGNINGGAQILVNWFGLPLMAGQIIYYLLAAAVVFAGMKAVGVAQKYAVLVMLAVVAAMTAGTFTGTLNPMVSSELKINNMLGLYSMVVFATSANFAMPQIVKGLDGDAKKIRTTIFVGFAVSSLLVLIVTATVLIGTGGDVSKELAYMELGEHIGAWAVIVAGLFSLIALLTTFWAQTLGLRDIVHEQVSTGKNLSWLIATLPSLLFALFGVNSFIVLTRLTGGVTILMSIMLIISYGKSRRNAGGSPICGFAGRLPFRAIMLLSTIASAIGSVIKLS